MSDFDTFYLQVKMAEAAYKGGIYVRSEQDQDTGSEGSIRTQIK